MATTTTVSILGPGLYDMGVYGHDSYGNGRAACMAASVVNVAAAKTTYALQRSPDASSDWCGNMNDMDSSTWTFVQGPSTLIQSMVATKDSHDGNRALTHELSCSLHPDQNVADCVAVATESWGSTDIRTSHSTATLSHYSDYLIPVAVTAGAEKLGASPGATTRTTQIAPTGSSGSSNGAVVTGPAVAKSSKENGAGRTLNQNAILACLLALAAASATVL